MLPKTLLPLLGIALALTLLFALANLAFGLEGGFFLSGWSLLSNLLVAGVLMAMMEASNWHGWRLALLLFLVYFIIGHFNILIEAYIFNVTDRSRTVLEMARGLIVCLLVSTIAVILARRWHGNSFFEGLHLPDRSWWSWSWRVFLGILLYFVIYAAAGMTLQAVYPEFMDFYEGKVPPIDLIFKVQLFRGVVFVAIAFLIIYSTQLSLWKTALLVGLVFSIFGGIAPLIPPNSLMPGYVRFAHGFEVGISNFLYGMVLVGLLNKRIILTP